MSNNISFSAISSQTKLLVLASFLSLSSISSGISSSTISNSNHPSSIESYVISETNSASAYREAIHYLRDDPNKKMASTSGLDKEAQKIELTQAILTIYDQSIFPESFWTDFNNKDETQAELLINDDIYYCFIENHNYQFFATNYEKAINKYVDEHSAEKVRDDLIVLIDSNLMIEIHTLLHSMTIDDKQTIQSIDKRLRADPYLRKAVNMLEADTDLSTLLGISTTSIAEKSLYDLLKMNHQNKDFPNLDSITRHLMQVMLHCGALK